MVRLRLLQPFFQSFQATILMPLMCVWTILDERLGQETVERRRLERELGETKGILVKEFED